MAEGKRILLVDDEQPIRLLLKTILTRIGYEVDEAGNGKEAYEKVLSDPPEIIIMDVRMPVMTGLEAAKLLKENEKTRMIPLVIVSSMGEVEDRVDALEAGADDFLTKPVEKNELMARVKSLMKVKAYNDHMIKYQKTLEMEVAKRTEQLKLASEKIKLASLDTIFRLSQAAEYKDEETGTHIRRMGYYTAAIARQLKVDEDMVESILYAAPMHDIGKIGIPDKVLLKPGKLNAGEWEEMKQHTVIGAKLLDGSDSDIIKTARTIALTHHEKWDGTGYPNGLKGSDIPLVGRIAAIADVFDALISKRPYKDPYSYKESLEIIKVTDGTHFDPMVTEAFFAIKEEIIEIKQANDDDPPASKNVIYST